MALNIKDRDAERLAGEVADLADETKTRAVKVALEERKARLKRRVVARDRRADLWSFLEGEAWPQVPSSVLGLDVSRDERDEILGYGPEGV
jgi:antitoxin VapB